MFFLKLHQQASVDDDDDDDESRCLKSTLGLVRLSNTKTMRSLSDRTVSIVFHTGKNLLS